MLAVLGALFANSIITVPKFNAAVMTGSSGMRAESLHSLADTTRQVFLLPFRDDLATADIERTTNGVERNAKSAAPMVDMIFLETGRRSEPGPDTPIPQHIG